MDIKPLENGTVSPNELKLDPNNPNEMSESTFKGLIESIKIYGILQPVVIDQNGNVLDGAHRVMAAKELNIEVPYSRLIVEKDSDRRIIRQILNKLRGKHDPIKDAQEFVAILKANDENKLFLTMAVRENEFYRTMASLAHNVQSDVIPEPPEEPISKLGDIWEIGPHRIMCGDSLNPEDVKKLMQNDKAHIVITDPPYGVDYVESIKGREGTTGKWKNIKGDELKGKGLQEFCKKFLENINAFSTNDSAYYIFFGMKTFHHLLAAMDETNTYYALPLIWSKSRPTISWARYHPDYEVAAYAGEGAKSAVTTNERRVSKRKEEKETTMGSNARSNYRPDYEPVSFSGPGAKPTGSKRWFAKYDQNTTWFIKPDGNNSYEHPTQKPVELAERAMLNSSQEGEVCLDLFTGAGFSAIASHKLKRIFRGMELEPTYVDVAVLRLEHFAQIPAVLIRDGKKVAVGYDKANKK